MVRLYELFDHRLAPAKVCWPAITNFFYDNARIILLFLAVEQAGCNDMISLEPACYSPGTGPVTFSNL